jgi:hypothetical protein
MSFDLFISMPTGIRVGGPALTGFLGGHGYPLTVTAAEPLNLDSAAGWWACQLVFGTTTVDAGFGCDAEIQGDQVQLTLTVPSGDDSDVNLFLAMVLGWLLVQQLGATIEDPQSGNEFDRSSIASLQSEVQDLYSQIEI